jgi:polyhydroxyalkanoate synthesis regulator phasin
MVENEGLRRYIDAGMNLTQITRARAEELVRELIRTGELERARAQEWVEDLVRQSRERSESFVHLVREEVRTQLDDLGLTNLDEIAKHVAEILARSSERARQAGESATHRRHGPARRRARRSVKSARTKKATAKKAPAKKATATKATAKKAPAKKATATKATAKKATAKKVAGTRAATRKTGARKAPAKKARA